MTRHFHTRPTWAGHKGPKTLTDTRIAYCSHFSSNATNIGHDTIILQTEEEYRALPPITALRGKKEKK